MVTIANYAADQLAACKRPRRVVFMQHLPASSSGRIMRRKLADLVTSSNRGARPARHRLECLDRSSPVSERIEGIASLIAAMPGWVP